MGTLRALVSHTFVFVPCQSLAFIFYYKHFEMKEITVKLLKIIKPEHN